MFRDAWVSVQKLGVVHWSYKSANLFQGKRRKMVTKEAQMGDHLVCI